MVMDFTLPAYGRMIEKLVANGYRISGYAEVQAEAQHLILRHDVDFDLDQALRMAEFEARNGWRAHYFVLLRSAFYNPLRYGLTQRGQATPNKGSKNQRPSQPDAKRIAHKSPDPIPPSF